MVRRIRRTIFASGLPLAAAAACGLLLSTPAFAEPRRGKHVERRHDRHERHERRHERHERWERRRDRHEHHHRRWAHVRRHAGPRVHVHGPTCGHRVAHRRASYYCGPCGHGFHSRDAFHHHLHHRHRIPIWKLPLVIVHSTFGWIFHG